MKTRMVSLSWESPIFKVYVVNSSTTGFPIQFMYNCPEVASFVRTTSILPVLRTVRRGVVLHG